MSDPTSGVERLGQVRAWFRRQRRDHSWFAEALRAKGDEFNDLVVKHLAAKNAAQSDLFDRAARLLKKGRLGDPECLGPTAGRSQRLVIACPCDDALAAELADWRTGTNMPPALRKRCARLALQQLIATGAIAPGKGDRESSRGRAPTSKATQVVKIPIVLTRPKRERANPDPRSLDLDHLRQFTGEASIAIASRWLEVLAHAGSIQRRLPEAARTGEALVDNMLALVVAKERANLGAADASLNPEMLTPDIAEEFQEQVDAWAREEAARRGEAWACSTLDEGGSDSDPIATVIPTDWTVVQGQLLAKLDRGESFTPLRRLAVEMRCCDSTIRKAINKSPRLKAWQAQNGRRKAAPKAMRLNEVVNDTVAQAKERAPDDVLLDEDVDIVMNRLIQEARPEERARLNAMNQDDRRELVSCFLSQDRDSEPSPVQSGGPGQQSRGVRCHKRV